MGRIPKKRSKKPASQRSAFWQCAAAIWQRISDVALVLWVLRIPVVFTIFGFIVLLLVPQAQDLLVNTADNITDVNVGALIAFVVVLVGVWAAPMHYVSRLLLDTDMRLGKYAKSLSESRANFLACTETWMPRILGFAAFIAMFLSCVRAISNLPDLTLVGISTEAIQRNLYLTMAALFVLAVAFLLYTVKRDVIANSKAWSVIERAANFLLSSLRIQRLARWLPSRKRVRARNFGPLFLILLTLVFCVLPLFFPVNTAEIIPLALFIPFVIGGWLPLLSLLSGLGRRFAVPIIAICLAILWIGPAWIGEGYRVRQINDTAAHLEALGQPKAGVLVDEKNTAIALGSIQLSEALTLWMTANQCEKAPRTCPRPIIVVGSGGASRAGFFTASTIGALLESKDYRIKSDARPHGLTPKEIQKRIFAFSTVSGSSVGAAMTVAAMAAADDAMTQPCNKKAESKYWHAFPDSKREIVNWRDCLEALMSADYLTPTVSGFMFRDVFRILSFLRDRATLLEESWERHFRAMIANPKNPGNLICSGQLECPFRSLRPTETRWLPLLVLNGTSVGTGQRIVTSILEWPARSDPDPLKINPKRSEGICGVPGREYPCAIFDNTFLYHWLASARHPQRDIAISTAASNSARFPFISPPGEIFAKGKNKKNEDVENMQDRIVDGGYFENYGALTALELVVAIQTLQRDLAPFILTLTNDPDIPFGFDASTPPGAGNSLAIDIFGPIDAIMNARSAAGFITLMGIEKVLKPNMSNACSINSAYLRVWPPLRRKTSAASSSFAAIPNADDFELDQQRPLSMSWWMSRPVQRYLHYQVELDPKGCGDNLFCIANQKALHSVMEYAFAKPRDCVGTPTGISVAIGLEAIKQKNEQETNFKTQQSRGPTKK